MKGLTPRFSLDKLTPFKDRATNHEGRVTVTSATEALQYLATIVPITSAHSTNFEGVAAIIVKITVESGTVGVGILAKDDYSKFLDEGFVDASLGSTEVQLFVDDIAASGLLVFRKAKEGDEPIVFNVESIEVLPIAQQAEIENRNTLFTIYDLNIFPLTYDLAFYLMAAEIARCDAGLNDMHVIFIPPGDIDAIPNGQEWQWGFFHILMPLMRLFHSVRGFAMPSSRDEALALADGAAHRFPNSLDPNGGSIHAIYESVKMKLRQNEAYPRLRGASTATRFVREWLEPRAKNRKIVVLTLSQYMIDEEYNSDPANGLAFIRNLDRTEFFPVIVPDEDATLDAFSNEFKGIDVFSSAAFNLELRMALYQEAWLNIPANGGLFCPQPNEQQQMPLEELFAAPKRQKQKAS